MYRGETLINSGSNRTFMELKYHKPLLLGKILEF